MRVSLSISPGSQTPIYRQIVEQVCAAALDGRLADDEPLPSVRALAEQLLINPNTVARAYSELARDGIIESRPGRGMFLSERRRIYSAAERARRLDQAASTFVSEAFVLGYSPEETVDFVARRVSPGSPPRPRRGSR